jgi:beta-mannanase
MAFLNDAQSWAQWEQPWVLQPSYGYTTWIAEAPKNRQLILEVDLIPGSLASQNNPSSWEQDCASGQYDSYALQLGRNLVAAGLGNSVIRLGAEMNGPWEPDFVGTTPTEQSMWTTCFANEVTALRETQGEHFLIDWNPNACYENIPFANYYPGNAYVDILGLDLYDASCTAPSGSNAPTPWTKLASEPYGLIAFETFAKAQHKPMSFPEWGLLQGPSSGDAAYINGIGSTFDSGNFSFESYYDAGDKGTLKIGSAPTSSLGAFQKWFN